MTRRLALCLALLGCGTPPEQNACVDIRDVPLERGHRGPGGEWIIGEWTTPRIHWGAFTTYRVRHGLGRPPVNVQCWVSFTHNGAMAEQSGSVCLVIPTCEAAPGVNWFMSTTIHWLL